MKIFLYRYDDMRAARNGRQVRAGFDTRAHEVLLRRNRHDGERAADEPDVAHGPIGTGESIRLTPAGSFL